MAKQIIKNFESLNEFYNFITKTPYNSVFQYADKHSITQSKSFSGTESFEEAVNLFKNGWSVEAKILNEKLKNLEMKNDAKIITKYDVVGSQASVPRYLQGVPTNMVHRKKVILKNKIITIVKNITYSANVSVEAIRNDNIKVLHEIRTLESQGYGVNLYVILGTEASYQAAISKIKIKAAGERLNISKVAFPLVHPSMLRRLLLRFIEVLPELTDKNFTHGYGKPMHNIELEKTLKNGETYIKNI